MKRRLVGNFWCERRELKSRVCREVGGKELYFGLPTAIMIYAEVKRLEFRPLKVSLIPGRGIGGRKNPSHTLYETTLEVSG